MVTLAYALDGKDKIACIDIDGCMDENGDFSEIAQKTFNLANGSYAEKSVSGKDLQNNHSNSDMALMNRLAFWCNGDKDQMLRMFAASGLYRPEKSQNYYECTLLKALEGTTDRYKPKPKTELKKPVSGNGNNNGGKR